MGVLEVTNEQYEKFAPGHRLVRGKLGFSIESNEAVVFDLEEPDLESFMKIPKWIQKRVMENLEFRGSLLERLLEEGAKGVPELSIEAQGPAIPHEEDEETPY